MRLLQTSVLALGLLGLVAGCHHTAGCCDDGGCGCGGGEVGMMPAGPVYGGPVMKGEVIGAPAAKPETTAPLPRGDKKIIGIDNAPGM